MKMWLIQTILATVPFYLAAGTVEAGEPGSDGQAKVVVVRCQGEGDDVNCVHTGGGDGQEIMIKACADGALGGAVFALAGGDTDGVKWVQKGDGDGIAYVTAIGTGGEADEDVKGKIRVLKRGLAGAKKGAFLGVNLSSTSEDGERGVRISGVIDDGPAAKAGLVAGDVILAIDDDPVTGGLSGLTKAIGARKPGDDVDVVVLRDGDEEVFSVTLGSRGDVANSFVFGPGGVGEIEDRISASGHMVLRNQDGDWEVKDLGDLEAIKELPHNIKMFMPKTGSQTIAISRDGEEKIVTINRISDGETVAIVRRGDGEIEVTRVDEDGEKTVDTYADEDELQGADEEAYDLLQKSTGNVAVLDLEGIGDEDGTFDFDFDFDFDADNLPENIMRWRGELDGTLGEAREAYQRAIEELGTLKEELHDQHRNKFEKLHNLFTEKADGKNFRFPGVARFEAFGRAKHAFEVRTDGTIEVKIRKGDSELVQLFEDAADMENREPKLYKKYRNLMDENE